MKTALKRNQHRRSRKYNEVDSERILLPINNDLQPEISDTINRLVKFVNNCDEDVELFYANDSLEYREHNVVVGYLGLLDKEKKQMYGHINIHKTPRGCWKVSAVSLIVMRDFAEREYLKFRTEPLFEFLCSYVHFCLYRIDNIEEQPNFDDFIFEYCI